MSAAQAAGEAYVKAVNAADLDGVVGLFASEATVFHPLGEFHGREAIREFYATNILAHRPVLSADGWIAEGPRCAFELRAETAGRVSHAMDHLTVGGDGRITRMSIAYR